MPFKFNPPLEQGRLRAIWKASAKGSTERELLMEIARLHRVLVMLRWSVDATEKAWRDEVGGRLAAIHHLRTLLDEEPAIVGQYLKVERSPFDGP